MFRWAACENFILPVCRKLCTQEGTVVHRKVNYSILTQLRYFSGSEAMVSMGNEEMNESLVKSRELFRPDMKCNGNVSDDVIRSQSLSTANSKEWLKYKIGKHVETFKQHPSDTGSSAVQSASLSLSIPISIYKYSIYSRHMIMIKYKAFITKAYILD